MEEITDGAWAVLQATHELQHGDPDVSIEPGLVRALALSHVDGTAAALEFKSPNPASGGADGYAGMAPMVESLIAAGLLVVDEDMAPAREFGKQAADADDDSAGLRLTDAGRAALAARF